MKPARWYCPPGVAKPPHAVIPGTLQCLELAGPPGALPGGLIHGGALEPGETGWHKHPSGWWFNLTEAEPAQLLRLDPDPRFLRWHEVAGVQQSHVWRVPVLLEPRRDEVTGQIRMFVSALDRLWSRDGWILPPAIEALQRRILMVHSSLGGGSMRLDAPEAVQMTLDILALGHVFDPAEVVEGGWISEAVVVRTLLATVDMEPGE